MDLTNRDMAELVAFRHDLHRFPEISNEEEATAARVLAFLERTNPDKVLSGMGGHGVAFVYDSGKAGRTLLFRAELDALPIAEISDIPHRSTIEGKGHMCGHDGHMAILSALGCILGRERPKTGRVVLMFQPAEETGNGAANVIADPRYEEIRPDFAFSLHNLPGVPLGHARLKPGVVNCASRGMRIVLSGREAHSSMPETGISPLGAIIQLAPLLAGLGGGSFTQDDFAMATVTHINMGEPAFGVAPGRAEIRVTLRTRLDEHMEALRMAAEALVAQAAQAHGLTFTIDYHEIFVASLNDDEASAHLAAALDAENIPHDGEGLPMRASEDFGAFGHGAKSAMLFLGAGIERPNLHNPDYDFPDDLIAIGARIFMRVTHNLLG